MLITHWTAESVDGCEREAGEGSWDNETGDVARGEWERSWGYIDIERGWRG